MCGRAVERYPGFPARGSLTPVAPDSAGSAEQFEGGRGEIAKAHVERALVDLRLRLAKGLKLQRVQRRLTQGELAKVVGSSQSRVAKMEAGDPGVSIDLLFRSLIALGASSSDLARIISARRPVSARIWARGWAR